MNLQFIPLKLEDAEALAPFFYMRPNKSCDSGALDTFLWKDRFDVRVCVADDRALLLLMQSEGVYFSAMPYCKQEDLAYYFDVIERYFNDELNMPLKIDLADEESVEVLALKDNARYDVTEIDLKDYLYDGDDLRTLSGKKFHKKKNLVNKFQRDYEGRWEYRTLRCSDKEDVRVFLNEWHEKHTEEEREEDEALKYEDLGIRELMKECFSLKEFKAGGIFIDGKMEAFSMGALNPREDMACIVVEKGNPEIPGIYQVINQQFLIHEFSGAKLINREDDCGIPGLRRAKESYHPIGYARKYMVFQKK